MISENESLWLFGLAELIASAYSKNEHSVDAKENVKIC
jgi:hypothetical protein